MAARDIASVLWALGQCPQPPEQQLLDQLAGAAGRALPAANAQDCAMTLLGLAKCRHQGLQAEWLDAFLQQTQAVRR
jgi:hypothetical protein